jgi:protein-S-isoprenylcysteine O-methyltransferase Ste14
LSGAGTGSLVLRSSAAWLWFALWFFVVFPGALLWASGAPLAPQPGAHLWAGLAVVLAAQAVVIAHVAAFVRRGRGTHAPFTPPSELVRWGLYTRTRNPMYLMYALVIAGEALAWRSFWVLAYALVFWLLAHLFVVRVEEPGLRARFGAAYDDYCAHVPRWIPRPGGV